MCKEQYINFEEIIKNSQKKKKNMHSIIIPVLDEEKTIKKTLEHTRKLKGEFEIIIVDGGSHDATRKIVEKVGEKVIKGPRNLVGQIELGIKQAKGDSFLIVHADTLIPNTIEQINCEAGGFLHNYDKFGLLEYLQAITNNLNARIFRTFTGEQGFYITREALNKAGGIPNKQPFEIQELCKNLKKAGVKPQILSGRSISSNRRIRNVKEFLGVNWAHTIRPLVSRHKLKKYFGKTR